MPRTRRRYLARTSTALLVACTGLLLGLQRPALAESPSSDLADTAAGWLVSQLVDGDGDGVGDHVEIFIDLNGNGEVDPDELFPDYGLTADVIVALAAAGVGGDASADATDYLEANVELYVGAAEGVGDPDGEFYAGALAKSLLVADVTGRDPADFGGVDLVARLLFTETPEGRFSDVSAFGDFSNNIGQSLAVVALGRAAPGQLTPEAAGFLGSQQCVDGGPQDGNVPLTIGADPCLPASASIDTTSFAVQAFRSLDAGPEIGPALDFLLRNQEADGGFSDLGVENANSTGLAAQAIGNSDTVLDAYEAAVQWLSERQLDCSAPMEQQGAIAFTDGPDGEPVYDDRATRASAQAVPGIVGLHLFEIDAAGSAPAAPRLECGTPTPTPTPTLTPTPTDPSPSTTPPTDPGPTVSPPGLPNTGLDLAPLFGVGGLSLLLGVVLLAASRRRTGAHR